MMIFTAAELGTLSTDDVLDVLGYVPSLDGMGSFVEPDLFDDDDTVEEVTRRFRADRMSEASGSLMDLL